MYPAGIEKFSAFRIFDIVDAESASPIPAFLYTSSLEASNSFMLLFSSASLFVSCAEALLNS